MLGHVPRDQIELSLGRDLAVLENYLAIATENRAESERVPTVSFIVRALLRLLVADGGLAEADGGGDHLGDQNDLFVLSQLAV